MVTPESFTQQLSYRTKVHHIIAHGFCDHENGRSHNQAHWPPQPTPEQQPDKNGDGKIEYEELKAGLLKLNLHPRKMLLSAESE